MMRNLPEKYIYMYHHFLWGKLVARTGAAYFKAVASDMKWKQSIQSLKKGSWQYYWTDQTTGLYNRMGTRLSRTY